MVSLAIFVRKWLHRGKEVVGNHDISDGNIGYVALLSESNPRGVGTAVPNGVGRVVN